ncbi:MAG: hypothetical protein AB7E52_02925 [Bdellovibrionales bacterium]
MFWDENRALPELRYTGHSKRVVPVPTRSQARAYKKREILYQTAEEICREIRLARPEARRPFTCRLEYQKGKVLCKTNGLYHILLILPIGGEETIFPYMKVQLNTGHWISSQFGGNVEAFNKHLNRLPVRERIPFAVQSITGHLPG